jgi:hypothetical protein
MHPNLFKLSLNSLSLLAVIVINYLSNAGLFSANVGEVSRKYDSLIVPSGYAFAIWGFIYLLLIVFVIYQWRLWNSIKDHVILKNIGFFFFFSNLCNIAWVIAWVNEYLGLSVLLMFLLLFSLILLVKRLDLEMWDAPLRIIVFIWWPITIYMGWIILASVANVAAYLVSLGWEGGIFPQEVWGILLILVSLLIYALLIYRRNMREAAMVGVWAYVAIALRQWESYSSIAIVCLAASAILLFYSGYHAYKNRATLPFIRKKWDE